MGELAPPPEAAGEWRASHQAAGELLRDLQRGHPDRQCRGFALLGLGRIGGASNQRVLLAGLGAVGEERAAGWCALALGLQLRDHSATETAVVGEALTTALQRSERPSVVAAAAIALGLGRTTSAAAAMRARLSDDATDGDVVNNLAFGLGLLGDADAIPILRHALTGVGRDAERLAALARSLDMLSDAQVVDHLVSLLADQGSSLAKVEAITAVLGRSGSDRAVAPLLRILSDEAQVAEKRALVAEGLGSLAAAAPLWWTATIGAGINYRAVTPTLSDNRNGILDHL